MAADKYRRQARLIGIAREKVGDLGGMIRGLCRGYSQGLCGLFGLQIRAVITTESRCI